MVAAFEILVANNAMRGLIREGKTHQVRNILASGRNEGMCTLETWLNMLVQNNWITYEDAVSRSMHPKEIKPPTPVAAAASAR
jgi:twitching motility protein PilT